jgi:hypothetical protein
MPDRVRLLEMALKGLEADRTRLEHEIAEIRSELGKTPVAANNGSYKSGAPKKRTMSPEARQRISEGMKRRYAEMRRAIKKRAA